MSLFKYTAVNETGAEISGTIEAVTRDVAIGALQRRGLIISSVKEAEKTPFWQRSISQIGGVSNREIVILSRQISTLFDAQVSALKVFSLLAEEVEHPLLGTTLKEVSADLKGGSSIAKALAKHPKVFSTFYVGMVQVGEESGKLQEVFAHLADHLDRTYEVSTKARNALIYPAFVVITFIAVMVLMLTTVIPRLSGVLEESGQDIPLYTKAVLGLSDFFVHYGIFLLILLIIGGFVFWRFVRTPRGKMALARLKLNIPYVGNLYRKLYLSRIADNMQTMLIAGIPMVRAIENTATVVGNKVYEDILAEAGKQIRGGARVADALSGKEEIPGIMAQMIRIGEETGEVGTILGTLSKFYRREVTNAVDTLVDLIEPVMIVALGTGVGILLASVLVPIYNIAGGI